MNDLEVEMQSGLPIEKLSKMYSQIVEGERKADISKFNARIISFTEPVTRPRSA